MIDDIKDASTLYAMQCSHVLGDKLDSRPQIILVVVKAKAEYTTAIQRWRLPARGIQRCHMTLPPSRIIVNFNERGAKAYGIPLLREVRVELEAFFASHTIVKAARHPSLTHGCPDPRSVMDRYKIPQAPGFSLSLRLLFRMAGRKTQSHALQKHCSSLLCKSC